MPSDPEQSPDVSTNVRDMPDAAVELALMVAESGNGTAGPNIAFVLAYEVRRLRADLRNVGELLTDVRAERDALKAKLARVEALPADLRALKSQLRNGYAEEQAQGQAFGEAADMIEAALRD